MDIFEKVKSIITEPEKFFKKLRRKKGYKEALLYHAKILLVPLVLMCITTFSLGKAFSTIPVMVISYFISGILGAFLVSAINHVLLIIVGDPGKYDKTYMITVYSSTPHILLGWVPIVNIFSAIYSLYLNIKGLSLVHKMKTIEVVIATLIIPIGLSLLLILLSYSLFATYLTNTGMTGMMTGLNGIMG